MHAGCGAEQRGEGEGAITTRPCLFYSHPLAPPSLSLVFPWIEKPLDQRPVAPYMLEGRAFLFFLVKTARPPRGPLLASPTRTRAP